MPNGSHFWTTDPEGELLSKPMWVHEGSACKVLGGSQEHFPSEAVPFYRWYNHQTGVHFWTTDANGELLPKPQFKLEGPACYVYPNMYPDASYIVPLHRWFMAGAAPTLPGDEAWCVSVYEIIYYGGSAVQNICARETIYANSFSDANYKAARIMRRYKGSGYTLSRGQCY